MVFGVGVRGLHSRVFHHSSLDKSPVTPWFFLSRQTAETV